jgi:hypothetical protein
LTAAGGKEINCHCDVFFDYGLSKTLWIDISALIEGISNPFVFLCIFALSLVIPLLVMQKNYSLLTPFHFHIL